MNWISAAKGFSTSFFSAVYPDKCALCERIGEPPICESCRREFVEDDRGLITGEAGGAIHTRLHCFTYEGRAAQAVRRLKFERSTVLAAPMAAMLSAHFESVVSINKRFDFVVPIPIHWSRRCVRGFNQSDLLAEQLPEVDRHLLQRRRATHPQVGLSAAQRAENLSGAFRVLGNVQGRSVLLVDDVYTSGATARECARTLKQAGARSVSVITFCSEAHPIVS